MHSPLNINRFLTSTVLVMALAAPVSAEDLREPVASTPWWEAFQHPGLTEAIEQGLAAHPDVASALARIRAAEAGVDLARADRRPEVGVQAGFRAGREKNVETGGMEDDVDPLAGSARLSWELDLFGETRAGIDSAEARAAQSEADRAGVRLLLSLEIARAYVDVALGNDQAARYHDETVDMQAIHDQATRRSRAGLESESARDRAFADWQQAQHRMMQNEIQTDQARARLARLVGGMPESESLPTLTDLTVPPAPQLGGEERLMARPDVVKAHLVWQEARGETTAASRARLPSLSLVASAAGKGDDAGSPESWSAWAGPVLSFPLWNPGLRAGSARARAREEAAEAGFRSTSLRAVEEIDRAWAARTRSQAMIAHMQARHASLASVAQTETRKRRAGLIQDDLLRRAQRDASRAARGELQWRAAALHAHLSLIAALGG